MKKLFLIIAGLSMPWMAFGQTFYDQNGIITGRAEQTVDGYQFLDQNGIQTGSAQPNYRGGWTFYDRNGIIIGSQDGQ